MMYKYFIGKNIKLFIFIKYNSIVYRSSYEQLFIHVKSLDFSQQIT
jgi:hypothetical protein